MGYSKPTDFIYAGYRLSSQANVSVADGMVFTDGTNTFDSNTPSDTLYYLSDVKLTPANAHSITVASSENGTITTNANEKEFEGETVTLTVTPDEGYQLYSITAVKTGDADNAVSVSGTGSSRTFTMPDYDVTVTATFGPIITEPVINGHTLLLSSEIGVQFKVTVPEDFDVTGSRMDFSVSDGKTESMEITKASKIEGQNAYWFTCYINALELADTITATYHYAADGEIEGTYSALTYINTIKATWPNEEKLIALVNAIQDYGYYLQNSGWTDNLTHTSIEAATVLGAEKVESAKTGAGGYQIIRTLADSGIADVKYSLRLNEKTVINIYVAPEGDVTISSVNATAKGSCVIDGKTYYQYDTDKIAADHLGDTKTITVTTSSGMATIQVSALSYVYAILSSDSFNDAQKLAMTAYYEYFRTTQEYVASLSD